MNPDLAAGTVPLSATQLTDRTNFQVLLNGVALDPSLIQYVGVAPDFGGYCYQINLTLPANAPPNPQIQISTADNISPTQRYLNLQ